MTEGLVSVIMPVFNAERFLEDSIRSVLDQEYAHWELLVVDNGSTDGSASIISSFNDPRIQAFVEPVKGVSSARNRALREMQGEFFCFLDADDTFSKNSLGSRVDAFSEHPEWDMVDGQVIVKDANMEGTLREYEPHFCGKPREALLEHDDRVFFGQTWMWRRKQGVNYQFRTDLSHGEDWWFCFEYGNQLTLGSVTTQILNVRKWPEQATSNLRGLEDGYRRIARSLSELGCTSSEIHTYRAKARSIMWKSYLKAGQVNQALRILSGKFD